MAELAETFAALDEQIQQGVRDLGWSTPTPVQEKTLPIMRTGADMIVQAHTGSGMGYVCPSRKGTSKAPNV